MIHEIIREEESSEQLREDDQLQLTCYSSMVEAYIHVMHGCYNRKLTTLTNLTNLTDTVIQLRAPLKLGMDIHHSQLVTKVLKNAE